MYEVSTIVRYGDKIKALLFKTSFEEYIHDAQSMITSLDKASKDVKTAEKFKEILKVNIYASRSHHFF